jgi:hypothetical protein
MDGQSTPAPRIEPETIVHYRTIYMPRTAEPRSKTFKSNAAAANWVRNYGVTVIRIEERLRRSK